ncbi:MAG: spoVAD [Oscillospiraceae bacterium]|jgi:stage V sporulation protein AD|nr:spoVAD [Oscillospiraceae bacterium]
MSLKISQSTVILPSCPGIIAYASVGGKKEGEGPLARYFDLLNDDTSFGEKSWEKAESQLQKDCSSKVLEKAGLSPGDIDIMFAGDLLNQCIGSAYGSREMDIPFIGLYGACSTMAESLALASVFVDNAVANRALALTSSHFCSAERQFRFPLEYGGQRTPTAQWTATASGSVIVGQSDKAPFVRAVCFGKIKDMGVKDVNNMGAAMAPAACDTIMAYLTDTNTTPDDYDMIYTGDLGEVGSSLLIELLQRENIDISKKHNDCGLMLYDREQQDVHAGGSGCGCSASVLCSYILRRIEDGTMKNVLFLATGAMMSPTSLQQGESIPGIAHLVHISNTKG